MTGVSAWTYLFSMLLNVPFGAGEFGESEYGEKADANPLVGEGMSGLFNAILLRATSDAIDACFKELGP